MTIAPDEPIAGAAAVIRPTGVAPVPGLATMSAPEKAQTAAPSRIPFQPSPRKSAASSTTQIGEVNSIAKSCRGG